MKFFLLCGVISLLFSFISSSQTKKSILQIPYSNLNLQVDGDLSEWEEYFEFTFSDTLNSFNNETNYKLNNIYPEEFDFDKLLLPKSRNKVRFRAFWNNENFCCAITVYDKHFYAQNHGRIDKPLIHLNDGVELYIDTKNEGTAKMDVNDYQFLIDIRNNTEVFKGDLKEILADTVAVPKNFAQNILFYSSVKKIGEINDGIEDSVYTIEIVIPFAAIGVTPKSNMRMRLDVCVNDIDYPLSQSTQIEEVSTSMWPFSWSGYSDFGYPKFWKTVQLTGSPSWLESFSEQYKREWFWIYLVTLAIVIFIISLLLYRTYKLKQIPTNEEIDKKSSLFFNNTFDENRLSYNQKILKSISNFIIEKQSESIHSENAAKAAGISLRTFQRITREELNLTPTNFIYVIKLKLVADFLKNKKGNVTDAAYEFGFSDPSYCSKIFKKYYGVSPTEFVKNITK